MVHDRRRRVQQRAASVDGSLRGLVRLLCPLHRQNLTRRQDGDHPAAFAILSDGTGVSSESPPGEEASLRCFPNPASSGAIVEYTVKLEGRVRLGVYDVAGRRVACLVDSHVPHRGVRTALWDGRGDDGRDLPSGVYFVRLEAGEETSVHKMVLLK